MTFWYIIETLKKFDFDFDECQVNMAINFAIKYAGYNSNRSLEIVEIITSIYTDIHFVIAFLLFFSLANNNLKLIKITRFFNIKVLTKLFQMRNIYDYKLQNVCFKILQPNLNKFIVTFLEQNYPNPEQLVIKIINALHNILFRTNIVYTIYGRVKSPYSIAQKITQKSNKIERVCDIIGIRVIVEQESECYEILRMIHNNYKHIPKKYKDFIAFPKENNYQSLHTIIIDGDLRKLEIQIRTKRMHYIAQFGSASHLHYKMQSIKNKNLRIAYSVLKKLISEN